MKIIVLTIQEYDNDPWVAGPFETEKDAIDFANGYMEVMAEQCEVEFQPWEDEEFSAHTSNLDTKFNILDMVNPNDVNREG